MNAPQPINSRTVASGVQKMTPSEAFVETMVAQGVDTLFGIMGSSGTALWLPQSALHTMSSSNFG